MRKKHHAYVVKWRDSCSATGWRSVDEKREVALITSVGWMAAQTPKSVTITTCISECGNIRDAVTIPREAITKITKLKNYILGA